MSLRRSTSQIPGDFRPVHDRYSRKDNFEDADGDGIDDDGDGIDDGFKALPLEVVDTDNDNMPDFQEIMAQEPELQAATGVIRTGLEGSGCRVVGNSRGADPLFACMLSLALPWLVRRHQRVAALALSSLFIGNGHASVLELQPKHYDEFSRSVYVGAGLGLSRLDPDTSQVDGWGPDDRVNAGGQINIGIDVLKHLTVELHSADLGSAGLSPSGRINYHINGVSALFYTGKNRHQFLRRGLSAYGRVGYGMLDNSPVGAVPFEQVNGSHVLFGAGIEYSTRSGLGARAEILSFDKDVQFGQLGLIYRVGNRSEPVQVVGVHEPVPVIAAAIAPEPAPVVEYVAPPTPIVKKPDPCEKLSGILDSVYFHTDSAKLTANALTVLDDVAAVLTKCTSVPVTISAHTDSVGELENNQALSQRRAWLVVNYLDTRGVDRTRLQPMAFGETSPVDTNDTREGRRNNRRVDLIAQ